MDIHGAVIFWSTLLYLGWYGLFANNSVVDLHQKGVKLGQCGLERGRGYISFGNDRKESSPWMHVKKISESEIYKTRSGKREKNTVHHDPSTIILYDLTL